MLLTEAAKRRRKLPPLATNTEVINCFSIRFFGERLSEKVHATIPKGIMGDFEFTFFKETWKKGTRGQRPEGTEKASPYTPYSIGNLSRVIFRNGIKLPSALRGCFVEVSHD